MDAIVQALRRSIKGEKDSSKIAIAPKSAVAIVPPKKVSAILLAVKPSPCLSTSRCSAY
jgi:hypothetical protein